MLRISMIYLGADHAGFKLKNALVAWLRATQSSITIRDLTPTFVRGDDYPFIAHLLASQILEENILGILICSSGFGMEIAANRHDGIRAVTIRKPNEAVLAREHNHANILVLGSHFTKLQHAKKIVDTWLSTKPSRAERHLRRIKEIDAKAER